LPFTSLLNIDEFDKVARVTHKSVPAPPWFDIFLISSKIEVGLEEATFSTDLGPLNGKTNRFTNAIAANLLSACEAARGPTPIGMKSN
jgi:hypothetical protein